MFVMLYMLILGSSLVATLAILARVRVRNHDHIFIVIVRGGDHSSERTINLCSAKWMRHWFIGQTRGKKKSG